MRKFLTERDILQWVAQGVKELVLEPGTVVTDQARERARAAGLQLLQPPTGAQPVPTTPPAQELQAQVRAAVIARLGHTPADLDSIIEHILASFSPPT